MSPATAPRRRGKGTTVDLDQVAERCEALRLVHAAQCLPELLEEASRDDLSPVHFLDRLLDHVHIVHIDGRSYRLRELDGLLAQQNDPAPPKHGGDG